MAEPVLDPSWIPGLDVSHDQGTVSWTRVARQGYKFALIRATAGSTSVDPEFSANWAGAQAAGLLRGACHDYEPGDDPEEQAELFLRTVWPGGSQPRPAGQLLLAPGDLPPALAVESFGDPSGEELARGIVTWLSVVQQRTLRIPILSTRRNVWDGLGMAQLGASPLWVAEYEVAAPAVLPAGWQTWRFWQYSPSGRVDGIAAAVGLDVYQGDLQGLRQMAALF